LCPKCGYGGVKVEKRQFDDINNGEEIWFRCSRCGHNWAMFKPNIAELIKILKTEGIREIRMHTEFHRFDEAIIEIRTWDDARLPLLIRESEFNDELNKLERCLFEDLPELRMLDDLITQYVNFRRAIED